VTPRSPVGGFESSGYVHIASMFRTEIQMIVASSNKLIKFEVLVVIEMLAGAVLVETSYHLVVSTFISEERTTSICNLYFRYLIVTTMFYNTRGQERNTLNCINLPGCSLH